MVRSQAPLPEGITRSIAHGRFAEAADALRTLVQREPSVAVLVALADMTFQLGELTEAKENALKAVEADPREHSARVLLARVRTALDERDAALADFRAALELARPAMAPAGGGPIALPAHQALHNLEQLIYLEQVDNLAPGTLLPVPAGVREVAQRKLNQMLDGAGEIPAIPMGGQYGQMLANPPFVIHDEAPPAVCLNRRDDWSDVVQAFTGERQRDRLCRPSADAGSARAVAALLPAIDDLAPLVPDRLSRGKSRIRLLQRTAAADRNGAAAGHARAAGRTSPELLVVVRLPASAARHRHPCRPVGHQPQFLDHAGPGQPAARRRRARRVGCRGSCRLDLRRLQSRRKGHSRLSSGSRARDRPRSPTPRTGGWCSEARSSTRRRRCGSPRASRIAGAT